MGLKATKPLKIKIAILFENVDLRQRSHLLVNFSWPTPQKQGWWVSPFQGNVPPWGSLLKKIACQWDLFGAPSTTLCLLWQRGWCGKHCWVSGEGMWWFTCSPLLNSMKCFLSLKAKLHEGHTSFMQALFIHLWCSEVWTFLYIIVEVPNNGREQRYFRVLKIFI